MLEILQSLFSVEVGICLTVAIVGGMVIGILPGLGGTLAVSLLTPITFGLGPIPALVMLTSVYTCCIFGGSFTSIIINTPGTAASAATALDGYELTKQGRSLEAIGWATISSMVGGVFGGICLLMIAPPLAEVALRFSGPEYFFIAMFGLTIIGSLAGSEPLHGYAAGAFGLVIGLVGMDANTAYERYTFGMLGLSGGVQLVPALIGIFAIAQMMVAVERLGTGEGLGRGQVDASVTELSGKFWPSPKEFFKHLPLMLRSSIMGLLIGILPGAGGDIGAWIGYNEAKRTSKEKEKFGHGAVEGIIGPEAANNAVVGGAYIPLLTLGVPGSATAAVLLGGLLIQGLQPGHQLFTKNAHIVYPVIFAYIVTNILMGVVGALLAKHFVKVALIAMNKIIPIVVILSVVGSYVTTFNMFDVYVMLLFSLIGYFMKKSNFPTAPVVLALILGSMAEKGLYSALQMRKGVPIVWYMMQRPLCIFFFLLTIFSLFAPRIMKKMQKKMVISSTPAEDD